MGLGSKVPDVPFPFTQDNSDFHLQNASQASILFHFYW